MQKEACRASFCILHTSGSAMGKHTGDVQHPVFTQQKRTLRYNDRYFRP